MKKSWYYKFFNIKEIEESTLLQFLFYAISFSFFVTFNGWISKSVGSLHSIITNSYVCPPYFTSCYKYFFYEILPFGYSQSFFYVCLYILLLLGIVKAIKGNWETAHKIIFITLAWKIIWCFLLSYGFAGNFDYYDIALAIVFLFAKNKVYFAKLTFIILYFLSSTIKIHEGWILGNYFNSLITGAPIFPNFLLPYITNLVIFMQILGCWFLLSNNKILQKIAYLYFFCFHFYSGILVNYRYIAISIPALYILFGKNKFIEENTEKFKIKKVTRDTMFGYIFLLFLISMQTVAIITPGDQKKTLEGNFYGMYMFEANHQCISTATIYGYDGSINNTIKKESHTANNRCDPYRFFYKLKNTCGYENVGRISWTFDHSINGHSYERIVDTKNLCELEYKTFGHNNWIKLDDAEKLNSPVYKNGYGSSVNVINQKIIARPYENENLLKNLTYFYSTLWIMVLLIVIYKVLFKNKE